MYCDRRLRIDGFAAHGCGAVEPAVLPQPECNRQQIEPDPLPPCRLVAMPVQLAMMDPTYGDGELVAGPYGLTHGVGQSVRAERARRGGGAPWVARQPGRGRSSPAHPTRSVDEDPLWGSRRDRGHLAHPPRQCRPGISNNKIVIVRGAL
jgi:hypothetical protein